MSTDIRPTACPRKTQAAAQDSVKKTGTERCLKICKSTNAKSVRVETEHRNTKRDKRGTKKRGRWVDSVGRRRRAPEVFRSEGFIHIPQLQKTYDAVHKAPTRRYILELCEKCLRYFRKPHHMVVFCRGPQQMGNQDARHPPSSSNLELEEDECELCFAHSFCSREQREPRISSTHSRRCAPQSHREDAG